MPNHVQSAQAEGHRASSAGLHGPDPSVQATRPLSRENVQKQLAQIPTEGVPALPRLGHCESVADDRLAISVIRGDDSENSSYTIHRCGKNERINEIEIKGLEVVLLGPSSNRSTETGKHPSYMDMLLEGHDEHGFQVVSGRKKRQRQKRSNSSRSLDTRDDRQGYILLQCCGGALNLLRSY